MQKLAYVMLEQRVISEVISNICLLNEEENPEKAEMYSAIICNLFSALNELHECIDEK